MSSIPPNQSVYIQNLPEKIKKEDLKKSLYAMFSQFGKILDVVCLKTYRLRGQAWIVFADISGATNALRSMQEFPFFEKPMRIQYAKTKSDAVAKLEGSFKPRDKRERQKKNEVARDTLMNKKERPTAGSAGVNVKDSSNAPNKILFVQNLPEASNTAMLTMLFKQFPGLKEVRMVEARPGIAFVEFENDSQSTTAMSGLQNFIIAEKPMSLTFAKQ